MVVKQIRLTGGSFDIIELQKLKYQLKCHQFEYNKLMGALRALHDITKEEAKIRVNELRSHIKEINKKIEDVLHPH